MAKLRSKATDEDTTDGPLQVQPLRQEPKIQRKKKETEPNLEEAGSDDPSTVEAGKATTKPETKSGVLPNGEEEKSKCVKSRNSRNKAKQPNGELGDTGFGALCRTNGFLAICFGSTDNFVRFSQ